MACVGEWVPTTACTRLGASAALLRPDLRLTGKGERAMRTGFVERRGKLTELDRSFDLKFWQDQPAKARFDATWELIVHAYRVKGGDVRQLRLQRSAETFQRQPQK
jgi:hypothetical protein